jgi:tetratricopeptide (TPR) repeat protein
MSIRSFPGRANVLRDSITAAFAAAAAGLFIVAPAGVQTQQEVSWCDEPTPDLHLQIKGCTALIQSGRWSEKYVAFAYNDRGNAYQAIGDFDRAIADYIEAIRLDPKYVFAHYNGGDRYRSAELKEPGVSP